MLEQLKDDKKKSKVQKKQIKKKMEELSAKALKLSVF